MHKTLRIARVAVLLFTLGTGAAAADSTNADDTARLLAGMPLNGASPLMPFTRNASWQRHAKTFNSAWAKLDKRQLSKIRTWSAKHIPQRGPVLYYMFSGPDFLYADAFFPEAATYVLSGLEPVGPIPDVDEMSQHALARELAQLRQSLNSVLSFSFFITKKMKTQLRGGRLTGTLPILYVFLARSGKSIDDVSLVSLDGDGTVRPTGERERSGKAPWGAADGAKIIFTGADGKQRTLYYFSTDVSNGGFERHGFQAFCQKLGRGDSLLKSASYLMHSGNFSNVRDFLLERSDTLVQDDSGIPVRHFEAEEWELTPFGNYLPPISIFPGKYQPRLRALFHQRRADKLDFGIGYRWRPNQSNLLLALRGDRMSAQER